MITFRSGERFVLAEKSQYCLYIGMMMACNYYLHSQLCDVKCIKVKMNFIFTIQENQAFGHFYSAQIILDLIVTKIWIFAFHRYPMAHESLQVTWFGHHNPAKLSNFMKNSKRLKNAPFSQALKTCFWQFFQNAIIQRQMKIFQ